MQTRPLVVEDLDSVIAILNGEIVGGVNVFRLVPLDAAAAAKWWHMHGSGRYQAIVAEAEFGDGEPGADQPASRGIAGWATFSPHSTYEGYDRTADLSVWVDQPYRGRGVGRMLVRSLLDSCPERNLRTVISRIESTNSASLRLHESFGFERVGFLRDVGEKFGRSLSVVLMQYHVDAIAD